MNDLVPALDAACGNAVALLVTSGNASAVGPAKLFIRCVNTRYSIRLLVNSATADIHREGVANDGASLLRCMYDAFLQIMFMTHDDSKLQELSRLYVEFEHIERWDYIQATMNLTNEVAQRVHMSERRARGAAEAEQRYLAVKGNYPLKDRWYGKFGSLARIADQIGCREEYGMLIKSLNSCAHAGPFSTAFGPMIDPLYFNFFADVLVARILARICDCFGLSLDLSDDMKGNIRHMSTIEIFRTR